MRPLDRPRRLVMAVLVVMFFQILQLIGHLWVVWGLTRPGPGEAGHGWRRLARLLALPGAALPMAGAPIWSALVMNLIDERVWAWVDPAVALAGACGLLAALCLEPLARHMGRVFSGEALSAVRGCVRRSQLLFALQAAAPVALFAVLRAEAVSGMGAMLTSSAAAPSVLLSLLLGLAGFAQLLGAGRAVGRLDAPAPDATTPRLTRWRTALVDAGLRLEATPAGFCAEGFARGLPVQVVLDTSRAPAPGTLTVLLPALAATHPRLRITARDPGEPAGVALADPILARLVRLRGVSAATAGALVADLHDALLDVVQGLPGAALSEGRLTVPLALQPGAESAGVDLDDALERCLVLAEALEARAAPAPEPSRQPAAAPVRPPS
jgi:hypothetical protein